MTRISKRGDALNNALIGIVLTLILVIAGAPALAHIINGGSWASQANAIVTDGASVARTAAREGGQAVLVAVPGSTTDSTMITMYGVGAMGDLSAPYTNPVTGQTLYRQWSRSFAGNVTLTSPAATQTSTSSVIITFMPDGRYDVANAVCSAAATLSISRTTAGYTGQATQAVTLPCR